MKLPYIIAEIGLHAEGDLRLAKRYVWAASDAGANAVKFQAVFPERIVSALAPTYFHQEGARAATQQEFFARTPPFDQYQFAAIAAECKKACVDFLCTPFDVETVEWLNPFVPAFKIASADITNIPLLEAVAKTGKPVYLSTGAATLDEVWAAIHILRSANIDYMFEKLTLLHCVLSYPTPPEQAKLGVIQRWNRRAPHDDECPRANIGYSDHTLFNLDVLTTAWLLGATVIEKHFTLDKTLPGNDHYHSMDPNDLRALVAKFKELQAMIGDGEKRVLPCEEAARLNARQSWHAARDLAEGDIIEATDVVLKRPGNGLAPSQSPIGLMLSRAVRADEPITADSTFGVPA